MRVISVAVKKVKKFKESLKMKFGIVLPVKTMTTQLIINEIVREIPQLSRFIRTEEKKENERFLFNREVQSGKTSTILDTILMHVLQYPKQTNIIIVRPFIEESKQMEMRYNSHRSKILKKNRPIYLVNDVSKTELATKFKDSSANFIALANYSQLKKLKEARKKSEFNLFIDEVDYLEYGKDAKFRKLLAYLTLRASRVFGVSATLFTHLFDSEIPCQNIISLPTPKLYKGIINDRIKIIPFSNETLRDCEHLIRVANELKEQKPFDSQPIIFLATIKSTLESHREMVKAVNWENSIIYNGEGCQIFSNHNSRMRRILDTHYPTETYEIDGEQLRIRTRASSKYSSISLALTLFRHVSKRYPITHIFVGAGRLAGRGISFVDTKYKWHLTHQYLFPSKQTKVSVLIQGMRLAGIYADEIPLTLFTTEEIESELYKGVLIQRELIERMRTSDKTIMTTIVSEKINAKKVSHRKYTDTNEIPFQIVTDVDDGYTLDSYKIKETPQEQANILGFMKAYKKKSNIVYNLVQFFKGKLRPQTTMEMKTHLNTLESLKDKTFIISNYTTWDLKHNKYKFLEKVSGGYILADFARELIQK
jgi:hypothetical protein